MRLVMSRAGPQNLEQILTVMYDAYDGTPETGGDLAFAFFGYPSAANLAHAKKTLAKWMETEPVDCWMIITDEDSEVEVKMLGETGYTGDIQKQKRLAAMSYWKFYPTWVMPKEDTEAPDLSYLETKSQQNDAMMILSGYFETRYSLISEPHVLCYVLATAKAYEGNGCGRTLMSWGCKIADDMMLPCYLEATDIGRERVYSKLGFEDLKRTEMTGEVFKTSYTNMIRRAKVVRLTLAGKETQVNGQ